MRVLVILGSEKPPTFIRNQITGLVKVGINVAVLAKGGSARYLPGVNILESDITVRNFLRVTLHVIRRLILNPKQLQEAAQLTDSMASKKAWLKKVYRTSLVLEFNPDLVHFQWAAHTRDYAALVRARRYKFLVSLRGTQVNVEPLCDEELAISYRQTFPFVYLHAVSKKMKEKALEWGGVEDRTHVIYSPVPTSFFQAFDDSPPSIACPLRVLSIGRFHWIKGYTYAIEAIGLLRQHRVNVEYTIVAPGPIPGEILYQIKDRGLERNVHIVEGKEYSDIASLMKTHDVLLLSSVAEGIANVVLEAMAVGLPVVSTNCGGMAEVIEDGVTGWLVPVRKPIEMAEALRRITGIPSHELAELRRNAHESVMRRFDFSKNIQEFASLYRCIAQQNG